MGPCISGNFFLNTTITDNFYLLIALTVITLRVLREKLCGFVTISIVGFRKSNLLCTKSPIIICFEWDYIKILSLYKHSSQVNFLNLEIENTKIQTTFLHFREWTNKREQQELIFDLYLYFIFSTLLFQKNINTVEMKLLIVMRQRLATYILEAIL